MRSVTLCPDENDPEHYPLTDWLLMAPNDETPEMIEARLNEHADRLRQVDDRLNIHARRFDDLGLVVMGSDELKVKGLIERTATIETLLAGLVQWQRDMQLWAKIVVGLLATGALGDWLPYIQAFLKAMGN
jgi:hypothetical protein